MPTWLPWILSAVLIGGSLVWIAVAEDKGMAIFGGVVAVGVSRVLLGDIARWQVESENARRDAAEPRSDDEED
jgi:hypothetical protein